MSLLTELREQEKELMQDSQQARSHAPAAPPSSKKTGIGCKLSQLSAMTFPADGIRRYEILAGKLTEAEATKRTIGRRSSGDYWHECLNSMNLNA